MNRGGARHAAFAALVALERGGTARLELDLAPLSARDRDLAVELARGVERLRLLLDAVTGAWLPRGQPHEPELRTALRLGAYQLMFLDRIPPHAAVAETVRLAGPKRGFVNAVLRRIAAALEQRSGAARDRLVLPGDRSLLLPEPVLPDPAAEPVARAALEAGLPEFLVARWADANDADTAAQIARAAALPPVLWIRTNRARCDLDGLRAALAAEGLAAEPTPYPDVLRWSAAVPPMRSAAFAAGLLVVQDPTAVLAAQELEAQPGERILDLCAAPGTKASLLAAAVAPGGIVFAFDVNPARRARLAETRERLGLGATLQIVDDPSAASGVDAVLADVPCSNTGVLARRVEVRRRLRPGWFAELAAVQRTILADAMARVRPGGRVLYSTCSIEPEENEQVVAGHHILREQLTLPSPGGPDGGYFALLAAGIESRG